MSKIMVMGPLDLLMETLDLLHETGLMQVDEEAPASKEEVPPSLPHLPDKESVLKHQLYEKLRKDIGELLFSRPSSPDFSLPKHPEISVDNLMTLLPAHLDKAKKQDKVAAQLRRKKAEYEAYQEFVNTLGDLKENRQNGEVQYLGVMIEKRGDVAALQEFLAHEFHGKAVFETVFGDEGKKVIGVIASEKEVAQKVRDDLKEKKITLFIPPDELEFLPYSEQKAKVAETISFLSEQLGYLDRQKELFASKWSGSYRQTLEWLNSRLSLMNLTGSVVRTKMCFFIHGWLPSADLQILEGKLFHRFQGRVVVEENELAEEDFSRIPTALQNPAYFEPFELFTRLLPLPPYASFDLTPFIGIFFPVFFGMMLGDAGYGLILVCCSAYIVRKFKQSQNLSDAGKILFISSLYTIVFGLLYGELFGTIGHDYLGLHPILLHRYESLIPMLFFAVAAGVVHVILGLVLGVIISLRRNMAREAVFKLVNIFIIICICLLAVSHFTSSIAQVRKPLLLTILVATPLLLLVGGVMAPLELLKNVGNIISYVRIMAVGLTSVLLAYVANYMAGRIGSVWAGIIVALLLHAFNLLIGVFAPTIHSLRLHYVEFLSKFMEPGGKEFRPLGRK